ncbi:TA2R7 protein, partial [Penelope pileata]|nr:TA2R7 protein [Penelope pileata]
MEDQHDNNGTAFNNVFMVVFTFQALAGMWINGFIVAVSCMAWFKKRSLNSNEKILLVLGCLRFWFLCITWIYVIISTFFPSYFSDWGIIQMFVAFLCFLNSSNVWTSACLYVFYCIKIANFRNNFFVHLKVKIDRIVPWLLLGSVVLSLAYCIPLLDITDGGNRNNLSSIFQGNFWQVNDEIRKHFFYIYSVCTFGFSVAFIVVIFSAFLLLFSLWRHKHQMQTSSARSLSVDAHVRAMKSLLSFFFIYSINYVSFLSALFYESKEDFLTVFLLLLQYAFPVVHSLVLIFSSPKLKKIVLRILSCAKCRDCVRQ